MDDNNTEKDPFAALEEDKTELYDLSWRWLVNFEIVRDTSTADTVLVYVPVRGTYIEFNSHRPQIVATLE